MEQLKDIIISGGKNLLADISDYKDYANKLIKTGTVADLELLTIVWRLIAIKESEAIAKGLTSQYLYMA